jgi:hypothetical protein
MPTSGQVRVRSAIPASHLSGCHILLDLLFCWWEWNYLHAVNQTVRECEAMVVRRCGQEVGDIFRALRLAR